MSPLPKKCVAVIGGGGREHAFCWKLAQSEHVEKIYALPGSPGIGLINKVECVPKCNLKDLKVIWKHDMICNNFADRHAIIFLIIFIIDLFIIAFNFN